MPKPKRWWDSARAKVDREARCRCCGETWNLQAAHTIGRVHDELVELEDGTAILFVDPEDVIPLCAECHRAYDARELCLLPVMTLDEQAAAVRLVGIERALHRLSGNMRVGVDTPD